MTQAKSERLASIDALRGFDMIWIAGGATLVFKLDEVVNSGLTNFLAQQMHHVKWEGFAFMDIIMPLFLFITGCSMVFSFKKRLQSQGVVKMYRHVIQRVLILWVLGMIYQGNLLSLQWSEIDFFSNTLQAIAIGYLGASLILLAKNIRVQIGITGAILILYWALLNFVPGFDLSVEGNLGIYIDKLVFNEHIGNPEYPWILASLGFTVTVMLGVFSGMILTHSKATKIQKLSSLGFYGIGLLLAGFLLTLHEPCIKKIWSSSFTLISGAYCVILLALFYGIIDVAGHKKWAQVFVVLGRNALLVYMVFAYNRFINLGQIADGVLFGLKQYVGDWYPVVIASAALVMLWAIFHFLNARKIFVKI